MENHPLKASCQGEEYNQLLAPPDISHTTQCETQTPYPMVLKSLSQVHQINRKPMQVQHAHIVYDRIAMLPILLTNRNERKW